MKTYKVTTNYGTYDDIKLSVHRYVYSDNLAICLSSKSEGPFATITVNLNDDIEPDEAYVDTNNCPWATDFIEEYGLGYFTGKYGYSGFCQYPLYKFNINEDDEL